MLLPPCHHLRRETGFPGSSSGKESTCNKGDTEVGSIPGLGKFPRGGNGNPSSILAGKIPLWATVHGELDMTEWLSTHTHALRETLWLFHSNSPWKFMQKQVSEWIPRAYNIASRNWSKAHFSELARSRFFFFFFFSKDSFFFFITLTFSLLALSLKDQFLKSFYLNQLPFYTGKMRKCWKMWFFFFKAYSK